MDSLLEFSRLFGVALGIGAVIFVHELGHFLAARWCGVRVDVFSIGFGPALLSWKRGDTSYRLAAIPLGGYVKMAGDEGVPPGEPIPEDHLPAKSVGQRFFIYSGGVLMNLVSATLVFPFLFAFGVPFVRPLLGPPVPGGPAWYAGLEEGTEVLEVDGHHVYDFLHIPTEVALGEPDGTELVVRAPESEEVRTVRVKPEFDENFGFYTIDVTPSVDPEHRIAVQEDSPAWEAGLRSGDRLLELPDAPEGASLLEGLSQLLYAGGPLRAVVAPEVSAGSSEPREVTIEPAVRGGPRLGILPPFQHVVGVRPSLWTDELDVRRDDRLVAVDGRPLLRRGDLERALRASPGPHELELRRNGERETRTLPPLSPAEVDELVSDLALAVDVESTVVVVGPSSPAHRAGIRDGDHVRQIDGYAVETWREVQLPVQEAGARGRSVSLLIDRTAEGDGPAVQRLEIVAAPEVVPSWHGLSLQRAQYVYRVGSPLAAVRVGVTCSWKLVQDSWLTLKGILNGRVRGDNVGGIITIGAVSYQWAESGWAKLVFFLCMLSVNLAFINVLPVPVLDGGHLFFLLVEKIKGSPVSERVLGYSQMVGLVLLLSVMVYVTFNDIARWFFE